MVNSPKHTNMMATDTLAPWIVRPLEAMTFVRQMGPGRCCVGLWTTYATSVLRNDKQVNVCFLKYTPLFYPIAELFQNGLLR